MSNQEDPPYPLPISYQQFRVEVTWAMRRIHLPSNEEDPPWLPPVKTCCSAGILRLWDLASLEQRLGVKKMYSANIITISIQFLYNRAQFFWRNLPFSQYFICHSSFLHPQNAENEADKDRIQISHEWVPPPCAQSGKVVRDNAGHKLATLFYPYVK